MWLSSCGEGSGISAPAVEFDASITSDQCVVTISYPEEAVVDLGEFRFDYTGVVGNFGEPGETARCRNLIDGATRSVAVNNCEETCGQGEQRSLFLNFAMAQALDDIALNTPADLFECLFEGDGATLMNLTGPTTLTGPYFADIDAVPAEVRVVCDGWPSTTTTTVVTTSTTLPCGDSECDPGAVIPVEIWLDDEVELGSLQLDIEFSSIVGAFDKPSSVSNVKCSLASGVNALFATNQVPPLDDQSCVECERRFTGGFVFGSGYTGPGKLLTCDFIVGDQVPSVSDFTITVVEASTPNLSPVTPLPVVSLKGLPVD